MLYFDWLVQNCIEGLCIMAKYFIFSVIGLMTHHLIMHEHHVFTMGVSMCMINGGHALIIGMYD